MSADVKGPGAQATQRAPRGLTYREQQAAATRDRIAEAARELFASEGYGATSMEAIAAAAGVAPRTVYSAFGTKREILSHICESWLARARARETAAGVLAEPDTDRRLDGAAAWLTQLYGAGFDVVQILDAATDESRETRELLRAKLAGRNHVMDAMIASIESDLAVPLAEAQALFRALAAPGVYQELVGIAGWTPEAFTAFVADTLRRHAVH